MKKVFFIVIAILCFGCNSDDDSNNTNLDLNLLYGTWYHIDLCPELNRLILNANSTYSTRYSGSQDCEDPEPDVYEFSGTFQASGNFIIYNQANSELIIDGTDNSVLDFPNANIKHEVTVLSQTTLTIKTFIDEGNNVISILGTSTYEH
jgi:hypothetical protein